MIYIEPFNPYILDILISWVPTPESLMLFAGPQYIYPLTAHQILTSLQDPLRTAYTLYSSSEQQFIGYVELYNNITSYTIGRFIINPNYRGKGYGKHCLKALVSYIFNELNVNKATLHVFENNITAITLYHQVGFRIIPNIRLERKINNTTWYAIKMEITQ